MSTNSGHRVGWWPLALLLAGLACVALALVEASRSIRSNAANANAALSGYARFAAWSYQQHLTEAMRATAREVLGAVNHGTSLHTGLNIPDARELGHTLPYDPICRCHRPELAPMPVAYFGFALGADTIAVGGNQAPPGTPGWLSDPRGTPEDQHVLDPERRFDPEVSRDERQWLVNTLTRIARGVPSPWGYSYLVNPPAEGPGLYAITLMPTSWGDTIVYAALFRGQSLDSLLGAVLDDEGLLPDAFVDRGNREILALEVSDEKGARLFGAGIPVNWERDAATSTPPSYAALGIRMAIRPELANRMVIGGLPRSRLPLLLALLVLATGLTIIAVIQLRRELTFAGSRARFVANVSHELRTPLAQIRLVVDTLRLGREPDPARQAAALTTVDREVTRLQHLVDSVLRFARGTRPDGVEARTTVDAVDEIMAVVKEFAPLVAPRKVTIEVSSEGRPRLSQEAGALRQVLLNLLDNAAKYGPRGGVIRVEVGEPPNGGARITVRDQGPGVSAGEQHRIWRPFERGTGAELQGVGGSGIGLTIVREIVERHGGSAALIADQPGGGFRIEWPGAAA